MREIEPGDLVIVYCTEPKEKLWGLLRRLDRLGPVIRGLNLDSFNDWLRQEQLGEECYLTPSTVFIPMRRIERIYLDESNDLARSFADRYAVACGGDPREALGRDYASSSESCDAGPGSGEE